MRLCSLGSFITALGSHVRLSDSIVASHYQAGNELQQMYTYIHVCYNRGKLPYSVLFFQDDQYCARSTVIRRNFRGAYGEAPQSQKVKIHTYIRYIPTCMPMCLCASVPLCLCLTASPSLLPRADESNAIAPHRREICTPSSQFSIFPSQSAHQIFITIVTISKVSNADEGRSKPQSLEAQRRVTRK